MTAAEYQANGYRFSLQVSDDEIKRAENEVTEAYVAKVNPTFVPQSADVKAAVMQLVFILIVQRHAVATRAGGKTKMTPTMSENAYPTQQDMENADRLLRKIASVDVPVSSVVDDICCIYYRNVYMAL